MRKFENVMLDLETAGTGVNSAILSIGLVEFDLKTGLIGDELHVHIDLQSCTDLGLDIDASTFEWWLGQSKKSIDELLNSTKTNVFGALTKVRAFLKRQEYKVWANSPSFDCKILNNAFSKMGQTTPWDFRNQRCVRTLISLAPEVKNEIKNFGVSHSAIDDCLYQIKLCHAVYKKISKVVSEEKEEEKVVEVKKPTHPVLYPDDMVWVWDFDVYLNTMRKISKVVSEEKEEEKVVEVKKPTHPVLYPGDMVWVWDFEGVPKQYEKFIEWENNGLIKTEDSVGIEWAWEYWSTLNLDEESVEARAIDLAVRSYSVIHSNMNIHSKLDRDLGDFMSEVSYLDKKI